MDSATPGLPHLPPAPDAPRPPAGMRRAALRAIALIVAATLAWLVFAAYRQPGFLLDFANLRLC